MEQLHKLIISDILMIWSKYMKVTELNLQIKTDLYTSSSKGFSQFYLHFYIYLSLLNTNYSSL